MDLLGKTFRCDSAITLKDGVTLQNGTLNFTNCTDNEYIVSEGTEGTPTLLTADCAIGDRYIDVTSASGLSVGDNCKLSSTATWAGSNKLGEIVKISSIAVLRVYFEKILSCGYAMADSASLAKLTPLSNITIKNITIISASAAPANGYVIWSDIVKNFNCENVRIEGVEDCGIKLIRSIDAKIKNVNVYDSSGGSLGIHVSSCSENTVIDSCSLVGCLSGVEVGQQGASTGQSRDTKILNTRISGCGTGINIAPASEKCFVYNCTIENDSNGSDYGIYSTGTQNTFLNNVFSGVDSYCIYEDPSLTYVATKPWRSTLSGNKITGSSRSIHLGNNLDGVLCEKNILDGPTQYGIYIESGIQNIVIDSNIIKGTLNAYGIYALGLTKAKISKNQIIGNDVALSYGIYLKAPSGALPITVSDNFVDGFLNSFYCDGVVVALTSLTLSGNAFVGASGAGVSCYIYGKMEFVTLIGNIFKRDDDTSFNTEILGDGAGGINRATVIGNYFYNGTIGLTEGNTGLTKIMGNVFSSMTISDTAGTITSIDDDISTLQSDLAAIDLRVTAAEGDIDDLVLFDKNRTISNWIPGVVESGTPDLRCVALGEVGGVDCYIAVGEGGSIYRSFDGIHWSVESPAGAYAGDFNHVHFGDGVFVAVGTGGEIETSTTGITWTQRAPAGAYAGDFMCCHYNGSSLWVIAGTLGEIETAADPTGAWTQRAPDGGFADTFRAVTYGNSTWILVGDDDEIQSSSNAVAWTQRKTGGGAGEQFNAVTYGNNLFVVAGGGSISNEIWTAPKADIATWTQRTSPRISAFSGYNDVIWDSYFAWFVAVTGGTIASTMNPDLITSVDGITWLKKSPPTSALGVMSICTDENGFYVCASDDALLSHSMKE